ncbi:MAG: hypothetical protein ACRD7E_28020, partial [Bryobacteraceae bacterium]
VLGGSSFFAAGLYQFRDLEAFALGQPFLFGISVDRFSSGQLRLPDLYRSYRSGDFAAFVQNDLKLTRRFSLNIGLRYEYFGVPHNRDRSQDVNFYFGPGSTIEERLLTGVLRRTTENTGDLEGLLHRRDTLNFAPSIGIAWDPAGLGKTVIRAGYSLAYDRIYNTVRDVRTNNQQQVVCLPPRCQPRFMIPAEGMLPFLDQNLGPAPSIIIDENLRTPYAQNWYAGVQHNLGNNLLLEIGHSGSVGRKLVSRDIVNRLEEARRNPATANDTFISNAGNSNYVALETSLRRRISDGLQFQVSYTYGHAIDNQSDLLEGVRVGPDPTDVARAAFTRALDPEVDRGNANFDQRHNLIFNAIWDVPAPATRLNWMLQGWTASVIGAHRSGFPVTVVMPFQSPATAPTLRNNRLDVIGDPNSAPRPPVPGGLQWMDPGMFRVAQNRVGNLGRGAISGPGFWNYDFALLKNFALGEGSKRLQFRAEFYNLLNHANLSPPVSDFTRPDFGHAYYGRNHTFSRFGDLPLDTAARRIQLALRFRF